MKKRKISRENRQTFLFSLGISLFIFISFFGLVRADEQGRKLSFGDETPAFRAVRDGLGTSLEINLFGSERSVDITQLDKMWQFFLDFTCIPHN